MNYIFWICWSAEFAACLFWIASEMKLQYLQPNPFSFLSALYLLLVLALRIGLDAKKISMIMVGIPAVPLLLLLLIVVVHTISGSRWN